MLIVAQHSTALHPQGWLAGWLAGWLFGWLAVRQVRHLEAMLQRNRGNAGLAPQVAARLREAHVSELLGLRLGLGLGLGEARVSEQLGGCGSRLPRPCRC
jgi:hypothetical protein